jgi:hypothetical protein
VKDFRSDPMPSADGLGNAKANFRNALKELGVAFDETMDETVGPLVAPFAHALTFDLFGFWLIWQLQGGFEGLQKPYSEGGWGMSRSAIFRRVSLFRRATGKHPDEYTIPGLSLDLHEYLLASMEKNRDTPK